MLPEKEALVTLVIPVYNAGNYLTKCLESIRVQSYPHWETILVDDCSTDNSMDICRAFAEKDPRFKVVQMPENAGAGEARWVGVTQAKGDFVGFVDSDDWLGRNFLLLLLRLQEETDADIVSCQALHCPKHGRPFVNFPIGLKRAYSPEEALILLDAERILYPVLWDKLYRREIVLSEKIQTQACEDGYALVEYFKRANKIAFMGLPLYHYNKAENSLSGSVSRVEHYKFYCHLARTLQRDFGYRSPHIIKTGMRHVDTACCFEGNRRLREYIVARFVELLAAMKDMDACPAERRRLEFILKHTAAYVKLERLNMKWLHKHTYRQRRNAGYDEAAIMLKDIVRKINKTDNLLDYENFDNHNLFE